MKLSKVKFQEISKNQELSKDEQTKILGGYVGSSCCFFVDRLGEYDCASSAEDAEANAYGTWACGTEEAKIICKC